MSRKKRKQNRRQESAGQNRREYPVPNREYKSSVFIMLFSEKKELLELYNAVSGKNYEDPELLEINTLKNAIYMAIQNDVSFVIDSRLSLYEHQSTYSPNLPLRMLLYQADLYAGMTKDRNLYGEKKVRIPSPQFVIFYNGEKPQPERQILRLSDLYETEETEYSLELEAVMLNINAGHNPELMKASRTLSDYAQYTDLVRMYVRTMPIENAVERAITECIREGILREFLLKNRSEAKRMSIYEYDQAKHIRQEREDAWEEGRVKGREEGREEGRVQVFVSMVRRGLAVEEAMSIAGITREQAERALADGCGESTGQES